MNILILTTGSVSAYLSHKLAVMLKDDGHSVKHYATEAATMLINAKAGNYSSFKSYNDLMRNATVYTDHYSPYIETRREILDWRDKAVHPVLHIDLVNWADVCVVCPADYNIVGKMANGIADDVVSCTLAAWLGSGKKLYICEAMNCMMYASPVYQENRAKLDKLSFTRFIEPTVKKLACGDFGIGALADVGTIRNIVEGHAWHQPIEWSHLRSDAYPFREYLPRFNEPGAFGAVRKFDIHEGIDIYTYSGANVHAVEDGVVTAVYEFTGKNAQCDWWNDTWCIKIEGKSGVVTYGEIAKPHHLLKVGTKIEAGEIIGSVTPVLDATKYRPDIRNHSTAMLHIELRKETCHLDGWKLDGDRDKRLLDPTPYLKSKDLVNG